MISQDYPVEQIREKQKGEEEMLSVSNKTDDENAVDDSIHKTNNCITIRSNADQNGNANERDEISEDHEWMKIFAQET